MDVIERNAQSGTTKKLLSKIGALSCFDQFFWMADEKMIIKNAGTIVCHPFLKTSFERDDVQDLNRRGVVCLSQNQFFPKTADDKVSIENEHLCVRCLPTIPATAG
ncbi:MAG: hypothetical protein P4L62_01815 [Candidatus Pacebacteria bacterium]|nr:hypothetical protein [Candidatus Paceibacterota bacterium]MDR3583072.1 hypothetical protein [Candidatus Paceibacterota bacterium]